MFNISTRRNNSSVLRCKVGGLLLVAVFLALGFASGAQAQILQHGASISKACLGPVRTCDTDADCSDGNECTFEHCDLTIPDTLNCEYEVGYNDDFNDTISIVGAWDAVDPAGSNVRSPAAGNADIVFVSGNTDCTVGGALPCSIGPDLGGGAGSVTFAENLYEPAAGDPNPLPDQANVQVQDACNGDVDPQCNSALVNLVQFTAQTNLVDGCVDDGDQICDDGDACTDDACDPATGECVFTPNIDCDDGDACTDDSCDPATGLCVNTPNVDCDDGDACTDDSCDPATGLCVNTPNIDCDDGDVCTDDSCDPATGECVSVPADPLPAECLGAEICRTPGFWGTHAGDSKKNSQNITQALIDAAGGLDVCGITIDNTDVGNSTSAVEAICVSVKGDLENQLVRQLTAAALNCVLGDCSTEHSDLLADCNNTCADGSGSLSVQECVDQLDCFNNGGTFDSGSGECITGIGECDISAEACSDSVPCEGFEDFCVPFETCHDRDLCPDFTDDGEINGSDFCFEPPGPAGSTGQCNAATKNSTFVP
jgi:hypothetical protein